MTEVDILYVTERLPGPKGSIPLHLPKRALFFSLGTLTVCKGELDPGGQLPQCGV